MFVVIMGVSGSGKTTVGELLAKELDWEFIEGDRLHPPSNIRKMRAGQALTEADRKSWLDEIESTMKQQFKTKRSAVLAASALRRVHRDRIRRSSGEVVHFVYLSGDHDQIRARLENRRGHFFGPGLLASQFAILEVPRSAITFDVSLEPAEIVQGIREALAL